MNKSHHDSLYWRILKDVLSAFSGIEEIKKYILNAAELEELVNVVFDDLDARRHFASLPDTFSEIRTLGGEYLELLDRLIGPGSRIARNAPIYDAGERMALFSQTAVIQAKIDCLIRELDQS